jgi:hypothetical protein
MSIHTSFCDLPKPTQAGILCSDEQFQKFAAETAIGKGAQFTEQAAAEFLRRSCKITSRRELATNQTAAARLDALRTDFDAWRGRIAQPRQTQCSPQRAHPCRATIVPNQRQGINN